MGNIGPGQLAIIALILLLIFGASRLTELGKGLGEGIKSFKKGIADDDPQLAPVPVPKEIERRKV